MARLKRRHWVIASPLLYVGVVGGAVLVAAVVSLGLGNGAAPPLPRAAIADRRAGGPPVVRSLRLTGAGAALLARRTEEAHPVVPAVTPSPAVTPRSDSSSSPAAIQPQTVSLDRPVSELPGSGDTAAQPSSPAPASATATATASAPDSAAPAETSSPETNLTSPTGSGT